MIKIQGLVIPIEYLHMIAIPNDGVNSQKFLKNGVLGKSLKNYMDVKIIKKHIIIHPEKKNCGLRI